MGNVLDVKQKNNTCNIYVSLCFKRALITSVCVCAYYSPKIGEHIKQMLIPRFWGDVGVKKLSQVLDLDARNPIFGHLKMGTFDDFGDVIDGGLSEGSATFDRWPDLI